MAQLQSSWHMGELQLPTLSLHEFYAGELVLLDCAGGRTELPRNTDWYYVEYGKDNILSWVYPFASLYSSEIALALIGMIPGSTDEKESMISAIQSSPTAKAISTQNGLWAPFKHPLQAVYSRGGVIYRIDELCALHEEPLISGRIQPIQLQ